MMMGMKCACIDKSSSPTPPPFLHEPTQRGGGGGINKKKKEINSFLIYLCLLTKQGGRVLDCIDLL
jgi:hypothetical protein